MLWRCKDWLLSGWGPLDVGEVVANAAKGGGRQQGTCFMNHCRSDCFMQDLSLWVQVGCYQSEEDILAVLGFAGPSMTVL